MTTQTILNPSYHKRDSCRLCASKDLEPSFALTPTPPANSFVSEDLLSQEQKAFPLDVYYCRNCSHLQLLDVVSAESFFKFYHYVSSTSPVMVAHLEDYAQDIIKQEKLTAKDFVLEFGSNDGTLLKFFQREGVKVLGVDPAENLAELAIADGVDTIADFFTVGLAKQIIKSHGHAKVICANNVCAHIDDLQSVIDAVKELLTEDGLFVFEVSYLLDVFEKALFDTIYHEHLDYHSVISLHQFFAANDMVLENAKRVTTQGGSIRCYVRMPRRDRAQETTPEVDQLIALERSMGLDNPETFRMFGKKIDQRGSELTALIKGLKTQGKTLAGYGAPAKATTLMHHFGLDRNSLDFIIDDNPLKQGLYSPGLHVPIVSKDVGMNSKPDYIVILAWNFADSIISRNTEYLETGGRFITPLPNLEIS